jgi:hypothetical protein
VTWISSRLGLVATATTSKALKSLSTPRPEPIKGEDIVLWYVAQMENADMPGSEYCWADSVVENGIFVPRVWPCTAGPLFVPLEEDVP